MENSAIHKFHIPVMGLAFTIDTPIKVAHFGIDSVISIVDDDLIEKMRGVYLRKRNLEFNPIGMNEEDYRARRISAYLNLVNEIVNENFEELKNSYGKKDSLFEQYINMLPETSELRKEYLEAVETNSTDKIKEWAFSQLKQGSIDVNIMTKLDKANYDKNEKMPVIHNDAHAALRGFANSDLSSSIVLSAGMNPRLYTYFENFTDFYPDENGNLKKKIILKVSDYRSALIQGKFLAKKGLWVSEYRIESGLNCGGHAFATDGYLMGPILEEFKKNRQTLIDTTHEIYCDALSKKGINFSDKPHKLIVTAQGGVGTVDEQNFLLDYYQVDSVGWGTPFLLVPEATNVDEHTLSLLCAAKEKDLYLSKISPLGVPFNSLRGNSKDVEKLENAAKGKPGSPCPKKFLQSNSEFSEKPICTASITYQNKKITELKSLNKSKSDFQKEYDRIIDKSCLCVGLAIAVLKLNDAAAKADGDGVLVCPGPNMAYFSTVVSLKEMTDHIYGRMNLISRKDRPNMFLKELNLYINYLKEKVEDLNEAPTKNQIKYFDTFQTNLAEGINYYKMLFTSSQNNIIELDSIVLRELAELENEFDTLRQRMIVQELISSDAGEFSRRFAATV
ncbi:MAG: hypothetical protein HND52_02515 [Ignavibacteriae bacterium]|nr:hypothetical protein [Ignavibacteriota bacterium]NOG96823.1 hypothetical protein [Ignavibacteriota bacterium]